jgi:hypothetical protein
MHSARRLAAAGAGILLYVVGGGALVTHLLSSAVGAQPTLDAPPRRGDRPHDAVVLLTVVGGPKTVYCVTRVDRVAVDALAVDEPDLPRVFRELGCKPTLDPALDSG